ncbi:MAG: GMC family oxidoreductase N-terminal domain-containing protein [Rhizobiaceae bacterium]|nr:GMC family oxidoreductase N-terminal domain-containing protein [Rhizobiaceae bacterium]
MAGQVYDFVIVGAGSAGCVLANRLSESGRHSVLLLEAGGSDRRPWIQIPIGYAKTFLDASVNWKYTTEPDPGLSGRALYWPRGKVLGGSSSINAMVYIRGQREDYDHWAAMGLDGWSYADVLPYFRKSEDNSRGADAFHGAGGGLAVSDIGGDCHSVIEYFFAAAQEMDLPLNNDFNGAIQEGVGRYQFNIREGLRSSAANAFLRPAMHRRNLTVLTGAQVTAIAMEGARATGLAFRQGGTERKVTARSEIILSAGAVNTPQLLMLSGLGPASALQAAGITVSADLPQVGQNLRDHLYCPYFFRVRPKTLNDSLTSWPWLMRAGLRYALSRRGALSTSVNHAGAFLKTRPSLDRPNMQFYFMPMSLEPKMGGTKIGFHDFSGITISASPCRPTSAGHLSLGSRDPFAAPVITPNYLSTDEDVEDMLSGVRFIRKLASSVALSSIIETEVEPGPSVRDEADLIADFRARSNTTFHPIGTCRMGLGRGDSVVDRRLKVHGIEGLRIADASVFPDMISGNTNATCIMIGEKAAAEILASHA